MPIMKPDSTSFDMVGRIAFGCDGAFAGAIAHLLRE